MKLRIQNNAIRLRLTRPEVDQFGVTGRVEASVRLPGGELRYTLERAADKAAVYESGELTVRVSDADAREWTSTERVGIGFEQISDGTEVSVVIEKDFQCMHKGDAARDPEAYPNPMAREDVRD